MSARRPAGLARQRLIAAADELFSRDGIAATPVDEAVRRAGVATATLYHHFAGKDALAEWEREGGAARGCAFVDAAAELSDRDHPAWAEISAHKGGVRARLVELATDAGHPGAEALADRLLLLYEGALSALLVGYLDDPIAQARSVAEALVTVARGAH